MCVVLLIAFLGPRIGILLYWIGWPARWELAFDTWLWPLVGTLVAPWFTLMWIFVAPSGVEGFDYVILGLAGLVDLITIGGGGGGAFRYRNKSIQVADLAP